MSNEGSNTLAPYAARDKTTRGRTYEEPPPTYRGEFQRDRDRIIHSSAFRRLEYKTQVFVNHEGDMFRTRLTHTIEVAQIARTVARALRLNEDLTEAVALAHDLGHTPFGHAGQDALNRCMRDYGGFEHNLQSLRVVDALEERYVEFPGLNLTFETREGILKHCAKAKARALGVVGERFINGGQPSLEAQVANLADEIAYNNHDLDDGLRAGLICVDDLDRIPRFHDQYHEVAKTWPRLAARRVIHTVIRRMINSEVIDLVRSSTANIETLGPSDIDAVRAASKPLISLSDRMLTEHRELKRFLRARMYRHYRVHRMTRKAERILQGLFEAFLDDPRMLPDETQSQVSMLGQTQGRTGQARGVADYIAGMTDRFAITEYQRIFSAEELT